MIPSSWKIYNIYLRNPGNYFLKIREICLSFISGMETEPSKLKKDTELYIRKNSKKILGGYAYGKFDGRI